MPGAFISDGYQREDVIPATRRHSELRISYRPMLREQRNRLAMQVSRLIDQKKEVEATKITAGELAKQLVSWDAGPDTPPVSPEAVARLEPNLFEAVYRAVAGYDDEELETTGAVEAREDADAKN